MSCSEGPCYPGVECTMAFTGARCGPCPTGFAGTESFNVLRLMLNRASLVFVFRRSPAKNATCV